MNTPPSPFNWFNFLQQDTYTVDELKCATDLANQWVTCACGELCSALPRQLSGAPVDDDLNELGSEFAGHIIDMQDIATDLRVHSKHPIDASYLWGAIKLARQTLDAIESRTHELLSSQPTP